MYRRVLGRGLNPAQRQRIRLHRELPDSEERAQHENRKERVFEYVAAPFVGAHQKCVC
jgi:hypothetical protein